MKTTWISVACALALSACASLDGAPRTGEATLPVPAEVTTTAVTGSMALPSQLHWRDVIVDPALKTAVELALRNNRDLRVAALNIEATRTQYDIQVADSGPTLNAGASATAGTARAATASLGVAAWELDLWGRLASLKGAALATFLASEQTRDSVQASLVVSVAQSWLTLDADQQKRRVAAQTLQSRERSLELIERQRALGAATALEVAAGQAAVETARGDWATLDAQVAQDRNALRLLLGTDLPAEAMPQERQDAADADAAPAPAAAQLLDVPAGLPSTVLLQRPDLQAAELALQAGRANVAAARAARFPTLTLTAAAGRASIDLGSLFAAGNGLWLFMPSLSLPIFDGGASRLAEEAAQVQQQVLVANYDKAIQTAFKEAADALAVRDSLATRLQAQAALQQAYAKTLQLVTARRQAGVETPIAVLVAQRSLYAAQQDLIDLRLGEQVNRLTLFKVLGGS